MTIRDLVDILLAAPWWVLLIFAAAHTIGHVLGKFLGHLLAEYLARKWP